MKTKKEIIWEYLIKEIDNTKIKNPPLQRELELRKLTVKFYEENKLIS